MNENNSIINTVINEQLNRLLEQERKGLELLPIPDFVQECPFISKDEVVEVTLRMAVMIRISAMAGLN